MASEVEILASETSVAQGVETPSENLSGVNPEEALKQQRARDELTQLELREIADILPAFKKLFDHVLNQLKDLNGRMERVMSQSLKLHDLQMGDTETWFEIVKTAQSQIVILEEVRQAGTLEAAINPPTGK